MAIVNLNRFIAFLVVTSFLFMRPGLFGQNLTVIALFLVCCSVLISYIFNLSTNVKFDSVFYISNFFFWILLFLFGAIGNSNIDFVFKAVVSNFLAVSMLCFFTLTNRAVLEFVLRYYIVLLAISGILSLTSLIMFFIGFSVDSLKIIELKLGYDNPSFLLFPLSVLYHDMHSDIFNILRFQSLFRESGIAQAFYIWAVVICIYKYNNKYLISGLLAGLLCTFSTSGIAIGLIVIPLAFIANKGLHGDSIKKAITAIKYSLYAIMTSVLCILITFKIPYFGLLSKIETHGDSISDRLPDFDKVSLLGGGFYSSNVENSAINLIKGIESLGVILAFLYIFIFTIMCWCGKGKSVGFKIFIALSPLFVTSLFAQPIIDAPLVYIFIFITREICFKEYKAGS